MAQHLDIVDDIPTFFRLSISLMVISLLTISISLSTTHWEYHIYDDMCIRSKGDNATDIAEYEDFLTVTRHHDSQKYFIHSRFAGIWSLCNKLSGEQLSTPAIFLAKILCLYCKAKKFAKGNVVIKLIIE